MPQQTATPATGTTATGTTATAGKPVAIITGGSAGLGLALARQLARDGWRLIIDARGEHALRAAAGELAALTDTTAVTGDIADPAHRAALIAAAHRYGRLDLLVNNAGGLGPSPLPWLAAYSLDQLERLYRVNVLAPLGLIQLALPLLTAAPEPTVINVSSDAAVAAYPGWGGYGSSKAALDRLTAVLGAEHDDLRAYAFDPGDMRTAMHQAAFPGEDISDRPEASTVVPAVLALLARRPPGGRYAAAELTGPQAVAAR
jgi:NAD(P)-dependent dehydrogenase (short-subunit alcohol dehydrogenase family)